ncbi:MAG: disulfide bond formation protein B [Verrucomicrobiota bacterium]|nr:disulfide bond formation protein B [Verrucomicrobiota bacterium]
MKKLPYLLPFCNLLFIYVLAAIVTSSFFHQFFLNDLPCDLCRLQRAEMLGIAISLCLNLRLGIAWEHYAFAMANALMGVATSLYQIYLHLHCPPSSLPCFGKPLYVWSFWIFFSALSALAILLFCQGRLKKSNLLPRAWTLSALLWVALLSSLALILIFPH